MRVIAGEHRGRRIEAPPGRTTRPTPDRVREALFSSLEARLGSPGSLRDARVLDLFAGSGALARLRENLEELSLLERSRILPGEVRSALAALARSQERFDAVFLDPPYGDPEAVEALRTLGRSEILRSGGVAIFEHATRSDPPVPAEWIRERTRAYGTVAITVLSRGGPPAEGASSRPENAS